MKSNTLVERPPSTQDVAGSSPARGSSFFLLRKKELSSGVVVYLALSLRMSLHIYTLYTLVSTVHVMHTVHIHVHTLLWY